MTRTGTHLLIQRLIKLYILICLAASLCVTLHTNAQTLIRDTNAQSMDNVTDVTNGMTYLLKTDDVTLLQFVHDPLTGTLTTNLGTWDTANSQFTNLQTATINGTVPNGYTTSNAMAAAATGRMYQTKTDVVAVLNEGDANGPVWQLQLIDSVSKWNTITLNARFEPHGDVKAQVVMGDFLGTKLDDPFLLYLSTAQNGLAEWGMKVFTAGKDPTDESAWTEGPEFYNYEQAGTTLAPVPGTAVAGDFNGDGKDEIAMLLNDYQTIAFYAVNHSTLEISLIGTKQLGTPFTNGLATLAAGRFRNTVNAELVAVGQVGNNNTTVYSIQTMTNGAFAPTVAQTPYKTSEGDGETNIYAAAGPLISFTRPIYQQLVIGKSFYFGSGNYGSYISIGSFTDDFTFVPESNTDLNARNGPENVQLYGMTLGNFNKLNTDTTPPTPNPALQLELFMQVHTGGNLYINQITIYNVNVPDSVVTPPDPNNTQVTDWLGSSSWVQGSQLPPLDPSNPSCDPAVQICKTLIQGIVLPADFQGRSLKLGPPQIVTITHQVQPELVLALPPMHIDWIAPNIDLASNGVIMPGCTDAQTLCKMDLTVMPSTNMTNSIPFATQFGSTSSTDTQGKRTDTTSWGISVKQTTEAKGSYKFAGGVAHASVDVKNSAGYAHDHNVSQTYNHFSGVQQSLKVNTGFADYVFYTSKRMNLYYYPVIGEVGCADDDPNCTNQSPTYVVFSVPDRIYRTQDDSTAEEWYQPVQEPGNVFSYPWNETLLAKEFAHNVTPLSKTTPDCYLTDSSSGSRSTNWTSGGGVSQSSGSTNSISDDFSTSVSAGFGNKYTSVTGDLTLSLDIAGSVSFGSLNENTASMSASQGITVTKPGFNLPTACCEYYYGSFIFSPNGAAPTAQQPCPPPGQTQPAGCIPLYELGKQTPVGIPTFGPLFTGFVADMVPSRPNGSCGGEAPESWWEQVYDLPDVALNHPARYHWDPTAGTIKFNFANTNTPINQGFYQMKGFFVNKANPNGQPDMTNLTQATDGDLLTLTARVYNYSLKDTNDPTLKVPAKDIQVWFYGEPYCPSIADLCGGGADSFLIGKTQIAAIPGFKSLNYPNEPNWSLASVNFDTKGKGGMYMVFWVLVWMEDANGNLVPEMPDHGLTFNPRTSAYPFVNILSVPIEEHSNNVGMYDVNAHFFIAPNLPGATPSSGSLQNITLSTAPQVLREQRTKLSTVLQATGGPVDDVHIAYYDGDPNKGGSLLDVQQIQHMDPGTPYAHRAFFTPDACGVHPLYVDAWVGSNAAVEASASTTVTIPTVSEVQALITATQNAKITDPTLRTTLLALLGTALQAFQQGQMQSGDATLGLYLQYLGASSGINPSSTSLLAGQSSMIISCGPTGFSVSALPAVATVLAGLPASYPLSITPTGGFKGQVSLSCTGLPPGTDCNFTSQQAALDGFNPSRVTLTVTTTPPSAAAGLMPGAPPTGGKRWPWFLMILLAALAGAILQRGRVRHAVWGWVMLLAFLGSSMGCGSIGSVGTPAGTYKVIVQASSGSVVQNTVVTLAVK